MVVLLRRLSERDRQRAFSPRRSGLDMSPYLDTVREMEGGVAYTLSEAGVTPRALQLRLTRAAKQLDLKLNWAKPNATASELTVELSE